MSVYLFLLFNSLKRNKTGTKKGKEYVIFRSGLVKEISAWPSANYTIMCVLLSCAGSDSARYSIYSGDPNGYFSINPVTGIIRTNTELDHETHPFVLLNVAAMTGDPPTFGHSQVCKLLLLFCFVFYS